MPDGIYDDMEDDEYRDIPLRHYSVIKHGRRSMEHMLMAEQDTEHKETDEMLVGNVAETMIFESPEELDLRYAKVPDNLYQGVVTKAGEPAKNPAVTVEGKARLKEWEGSLEEGCQIVPGKVWDRAEGINEAVRAHPIAQGLIEQGKSQVTVIWTDPASGERLKGRLDRWIPALIVDLKTCDNVDEEFLRRQIDQLGYDIQAAMYLDGVLALKQNNANWLWIFAESKPPHRVRVEAIEPMTVRAGRSKYRTILKQRKQWELDGRPIQFPKVGTIGLNEFALKMELGDAEYFSATG